MKFLSEFKGMDDYKIIDAEKEFLLTIKGNNQEDFNVRGFIDLLYYDNEGRLVVHDWKSKSRFKSKNEQKDYARQLYMYSHYVKDIYGKFPDLLRFGMFRKQKQVDIPFDKTDFESAMNWIQETVRSIRNETKFKKNKDDWFCSQICDFRNIGLC